MQTKLLKTTVNINFILVGLFGNHLLSLAKINSIRNIKVYFTFTLVDCVLYKKISLNQGLFN